MKPTQAPRMSDDALMALSQAMKKKAGLSLKKRMADRKKAGTAAAMAVAAKNGGGSTGMDPENC